MDRSGAPPGPQQPGAPHRGPGDLDAVQSAHVLAFACLGSDCQRLFAGRSHSERQTGRQSLGVAGSDATDLDTAVSAVVTVLKTKAGVPDYTIDGQSVKYGSLVKTLRELRELQATMAGAWEVETIGEP